MRIVLPLIAVFLCVCLPCSAAEFTAPAAPDAAQRYMPDETETFSEGLLYIIRTALKEINPSLHEAVEVCTCIVAVAVLLAIITNLLNAHRDLLSICGVAVICVLMMQTANSLIRLGTDTAQSITQYGRLLTPVMTSALAAQGAVGKSGALFAASVFVNNLLSGAITDVLTPLIYCFLCIGISGRISNQVFIINIKKFIKWLIVWGLKTTLYIFTGYISITGIVSGSADAATLKATKLTISSMVPVIGNILSDASEAVIAGAGIMKNAAGVYGLFTFLAVTIGPFLRIGVQYLLLKLSGGICQIIGATQISGIVQDFSDAMGIVLAMIGTVCVISLISTASFIKGVGV